MSSFIFSFKAYRPFAAALALIALTEAVVGLSLRPNIVERSKSNLLNRFHDTVIFGKLAEFADSSPDIVQVGDSSGFHGVRSDVVMRYLDGLKYVNLSCCAYMGHEAYYAIADFMLQRNPSIKAVVLYISLRNLPRAESIQGQAQIGEFVENSLTTPFAYLSPPTVALRQRIVDAMERKGQSKLDAIFTDELRQSSREHNGWWAEHDRRVAGDKRTELWRQTCGPTGIAKLDRIAKFYDEKGHSYLFSQFQRFASLTARHGAKFIVIFQPYSCRGLEGNLLQALREDIRTLLKQNPNMVVLPEGMLEIWPAEKFVSADHLRVGYDEENFRRVGKLLAPVFGVVPPADPPGQTGDGAIRGNILPAISEWKADGVAVTAEDGKGDAHRLVESIGPSPHQVETRLAGLMPGRTAVLSFPARAIGARGVLVELQTAGRRGGGYCDLPGSTAQRDGDMLDAGLEPEGSGWWRCWIAMAVDAPNATLRLRLVNERLDPDYVENAQSGVEVGPVEMRETTHFLAQEPSPW